MGQIIAPGGEGALAFVHGFFFVFFFIHFFAFLGSFCGIP